MWACTQSTLPTLSIEAGTEQDSLAFVLLVGDSICKADTLELRQGELSLSPDTADYHEAFVCYDVSPNVWYYRYAKGAWQKSQPRKSADTIAHYLPDFYTANVERKEQNLKALASEMHLALVFASYKHKVADKKLLDSLRAKYPKDRLKFVYFYLSPSDSSVRRMMKQDTLKGLAFSDTLGEVSRLREHLGIGRSPRAETFIVHKDERITKL